jgi:nucleoside-triphosphatase THEP1
MIFILTGPVHSGKTTLLEYVVRELKRQKYRIGGFLSDPIWEGEQTVGYDLFDLREERSIPFIRSAGEEKWQKIGSYFFIPQGMTQAEKIILGEKDVDLLVVDEVGPLELTGEGFWPALKQVISDPIKSFLFVARKSILEDFLLMLGKREVKIFDVKNKEAVQQMIEAITIEKKGQRT